MKDNQFLDAATRLVLLDFAFWNGNLGTYAVTRLSFEFAESGVAFQDVNVNVLQQRFLVPLGYGSVSDVMSTLGMVAIAFFVIYYFAEEVGFGQYIHIYTFSPMFRWVS